MATGSLCAIAGCGDPGVVDGSPEPAARFFATSNAHALVTGSSIRERFELRGQPVGGEPSRWGIQVAAGVDHSEPRLAGVMSGDGAWSNRSLPLSCPSRMAGGS